MYLIENSLDYADIKADIFQINNKQFDIKDAINQVINLLTFKVVN